MIDLLKKLDKFDWGLVALAAFHLVANIVWINLNTAPLPHDQAGHSLIAFDFAEVLAGRNKTPILEVSTYYPPFVHFLTALAFLVFGFNLNLGAVLVSFFFLLSIVFLYLYTFELFQKKPLALLASVIYSFLPAVYSQARWFLLEIPLLALFLGSLYFLEKSKGFRKLKSAVLFAILAGLAIMIKWTAVIFLAVPVYLTLKRGFNFRNLLFSLMIVAIIIAPWYAHNLRNISELAQIFALREIGDPEQILSLANFTFYLNLLANLQLTLFGFVIFAFGVFYFSFLNKNEKILFLLKTMLFSYFFFTFIPNKNIRYTLPLLSFSAIIMACFLIILLGRTRQFGHRLLKALLAYYLLYFFSLSFGFPFDAQKVNYQKAMKFPLVGWVDYINLGAETSFYLAPKFDSTQWPNEKILKDMKNNLNPHKPNVLLVVDKVNLNLGNLTLLQKKLKMTGFRLETPYTTFSFKNLSELESYVAFFDLALVVEDSFGSSEALRHKKALEQIKQLIIDSPDRVRLIKSYHLPDEDRVHLYKLKI